MDRGGFPKAGFGSGDRALPSVPRSPVQEYEQRLARLRADYEAEQESRARLEEDITAMRNSYDVKLSTLEQTLRKETGGPAPPGRREPSLLPPTPAGGPQFCFLLTTAQQGRHLHRPCWAVEETEAQRG